MKEPLLSEQSHTFRDVSPGKRLRAPFLFEGTAPIILAPIDDFLLFGPKGGLENRTEAVSSVVNARPDAILTFAGTAAHYSHILTRVPLILNLSASTTHSLHSSKVPLAGIDSALKLNAAGVAFHINLLAPEANRMIEAASTMVEHASRYDLPCLGIVYPRGEHPDGTDDNSEALRSEDPEAFADLIAHCVAIGADLGFDCVKTFFTDSVQTFERVINAAGPMPILVAGGPLVASANAKANAISAIEAGASGISYGRNLFGRTSPESFVASVRQHFSPQVKTAPLQRVDVELWLQALVSAWTNIDPSDASALFSDCVEYYETPFADNAAENSTGIANLWNEIVAQSDVEIETNILTIDDNEATVAYRASFVNHGAPHRSSGIWHVTFDEGRRCVGFRQWFMVNGTPG